MPKVSVIIPFYNASLYLREAIESILQQTYTDFELLLLNDGSTDSSLAIAQSYTDSRISLSSFTENKGLVWIRNYGISIAKGKYIAWLDADDIALSHRLAIQVAYLEKNQKVALLGACAMYVKENGEDIALVSPKIDSEKLPIWLLFQNCFLQSTVMLRKECLFYPTQVAYRTAFPPAEDYDLWVQIAQHHKIANLSICLVQHRKHAKNATYIQQNTQENNILAILNYQLKAMGVIATLEELLLHRQIIHYSYTPNIEKYTAISVWLTKLQEINKHTKKYPTKLFNHVLSEIWHHTTLLHLHNHQTIREIKTIFINSPLTKLLSFKVYLRLWFLLTVTTRVVK
jgi:glycosyltransferase involved in cell wall biosynthesis